MKPKKQQELILQAKEPAPEGSIGMFFDYYYRKGLLHLPKGVVINANKFKGNDNSSTN